MTGTEILKVWGVMAERWEGGGKTPTNCKTELIHIKKKNTHTHPK